MALVPGKSDGCRLDKALADLAPGTGLRGRRRLIEDGRVLLEGKPAKPGTKVRAGQRVQLLPGQSAAPELPPIVAQNTDFAALAKPAGLHSAALAGRTAPSAEAVLPELFPGCGATLVNRLDNPTSGLLMVALHPEAAARYRDYEDAGRITKTYFALVAGCLADEVLADAALDIANRKRTRVLAGPDPDPLRHTRLVPLEYRAELDQTLVRAVIRKGARHQIRAHLAGLGHPIVGDALYGEQGESGGLRLHHGRIELPGFSAEFEPDWIES